MKYINFTLSALALTTFLSCNSGNKVNDIQDTDSTEITADTVITKNNISTKLDSVDTKFLNNVAISGMTMVEMSSKISQSSKNKSIVALAQQMIKDHTTTNASLIQIAEQKGYNLPKTLSSNQIEKIKTIETFKEDGKNELFVQTLLDDYQKASIWYAGAIKSKDLDIAAFAKSNQPMLDKHYAEIKKLEKMIIEAKAGQGDDPLKKSDQTKK